MSKTHIRNLTAGIDQLAKVLERPGEYRVKVIRWPAAKTYVGSGAARDPEVFAEWVTTEEDCDCGTCRGARPDGMIGYLIACTSDDADHGLTITVSA